MINRKCTNLNDSLAKAIERVCKQKDKENFDNEYYESFEWFWDKKKKEKKWK